MAISGCAVSGNHNLEIDTKDSPIFAVQSSKVTVANISKVVATMEITLGLGFERLADSNYNPTPADLLKTKLERSLKAVGSNGVIDILIQDSGIFVKRQIEDRIPIVNLFSFGRTIRPLMCRVEVVIRNDGASKRQVFDQVTEPLDPTNDIETKLAISKCQYDLVGKIASMTQSMILDSDQPSRQNPLRDKSVVDQLIELGRLKDSGHLTVEEFERAKQKVLTDGR